MNRHEIISHFYSKDGLNEEGQNILEALQFNSYPEALIWIAHEFTQIKLDWRNIGGGSPYTYCKDKYKNWVSLNQNE